MPRFRGWFRLREDEPVAPRRLTPSVSRDVETICLKCLEKEPDRRYSTAREVAEDLERFLSGEPIQARRASPVYKLGKKIRKHKVLTSVAVAALAVMAILVVLSIRTEIEGRRRAAVAAAGTVRGLPRDAKQSERSPPRRVPGAVPPLSRSIEAVPVSATIS